MSQRFSESMFTGPELDSSARDVITAAGSRVGQATERLLDMLENTILQVAFLSTCHCKLLSAFV